MKITKLLTFMILSFPLISLAREGLQQDFTFVVENSIVDITIGKDGSYETTSTETFKILKDEAKQFFGPYKNIFDPSEEDVSVVEAYVINDGKRIEVDKNNIQKSNSAAQKNGIITKSELAIPFSQIKPGSLVYFKLLSKHKAGPFADYFSFHNNYGDSIPEIQDIVKIKSPKELFFTENDPSQVLDVKTSKDNEGNFILESSMLKPHHHIAVNEVGQVGSEETTSLKVSNLDSWEKLGQLINDKFISVQLEESLPATLKEVINKIPKDTSFEKKVDAVLIYITSNYDYLGDWRGSGKVVPKKIERIVADRFGDCKDFSTLLIKMLREMNINANYALVQRSYSPSMTLEKSVPLMDYFNHMIVRVENQGKVYWIDPTNSYSVGVETRADISGKPVLALIDKKGVLEKIPEMDLSKQLLSQSKLYQFDSADSATVDAVFKVKGESAKIILDAFKGKNSTEIQDALMKSIAKEERHAVMSFNLQDKKEKAYYDLNIKAKYKASQLMIKNKNELSGKIELPRLDLFQIFTRFRLDGIGRADIKMMPKMENAYLYKNIFLSGSFPKTCKIKSDWVEASRKIETKENGFILKDIVEFKKTMLTKEIYANASFTNLVSNLNNCFTNNFAEYIYDNKKHSDNLTTFQNSLAKLSLNEKIDKRIKKSYEVMDARGKAKNPNDLTLEDARLLLEKNLEEKPNDSETFRAMSAYYSDSAFIVGNTYIDSELQQSLDYINKSIASDPSNINALVDKVNRLYDLKSYALSQELLQKSVSTTDLTNAKYTTLRKITSAFFRLKDQANAIKFFELALAKAPDDSDKAIMYANRASYYMDVKQDAKCIEDYENSLKLNDKVAWNFGNVAICYNHAKQFDLAIDRAKKAISIMDYGAAHYVLADSFLGKGQNSCDQKKYKECEENFQLALMEFPRADIYVNLYRLYLMTRESEKAQEASKKALLAVDETYTLDWVRTSLNSLNAYQEKAAAAAAKRQIAQENKGGKN